MTPRQPGMDHPHYPWSPLPSRPKLSWPGDAPLALCVIVHLEHYEPPSAVQHSEYSRRAYGNRVGIFRILETMKQAGIPGTAAIDIHTASHSPYLLEACRSHDWEIIGHGLVGSSPISSKMTEDEERTYIAETLDQLRRRTGEQPIGWLGADFGESARTPILLAEQGIRYVCDFPNDEQPYAMTVPQGSLTALPILIELEDLFAIEQRRLTTWRWQRAVEEAADVMIAEAGTGAGAHLLTLSIRPWIIGQPHRIRIFGDLLRHLVSRGAWAATGREIVEAVSPMLTPEIA